MKKTTYKPGDLVEFGPNLRSTIPEAIGKFGKIIHVEDDYRVWVKPFDERVIEAARKNGYYFEHKYELEEFIKRHIDGLIPGSKEIIE